MNHAVDVVTKALIYMQFVVLLEEHETEHGDTGYH